MRKIGRVRCRTCTAWLDWLAIDPDEHQFRVDIELCEKGCRRLHPRPAPCQICQKVRADQLAVAKMQDDAGYGPEPPPNGPKLSLERLIELSDLIWGDKNPIA